MICTKSCNLLLDDLAQSIFYLEWRTFGLDLDFDFGGFCLRLLDCHVISELVRLRLLQLFGRRPGSRTPRLLVLSETDFPVFLVAHINLGPVSTLNLLRSWLTFTSRPDLALCTLEVGVRVERTNNCFADSPFTD